MVEESAESRESSIVKRVRARLREEKLQWIVAIVILAGLAAIAAALSDSMVVGKWFAAALCGLLIFILAVASVTLRVVRAFLQKTRLRLKSWLRHGLANLYRPGNQSAAVLAALGLGVMLILTVFLLQKGVVERMQASAAHDMPNVFLIDISAQELPGLKQLLAKQPGVIGNLETLPIVSARVISIDGTPVDDLNLKNYPKRLLRSAPVSWSQNLPAGIELVRGKWWEKDDGQSMAVTKRIARRLHLHIGSKMVFVSNQKNIQAEVAAIIKPDGQHVYGRANFILTPEALAGLPAVWYGAVHVEPAQVGDDAACALQLLSNGHGDQRRGCA